ncbi:MAG: cytochrome c3 family protein [Deltaproteobacteria bacterium]|nr:cytochrome c3 family protein [Deltaproteobacteria bacterium]
MALGPLLALALSALPPAPEKVVLQTRSFGTVTVDHAAHLRRRARCFTCHGPGPVTKLGRFEPKEAHDRCIGCHKAEARGPTACRQCHVVADPAAPSAAVMAATAGAGPPQAGAPAPTAGAGPPAAGAAPQAGGAVLARAGPAHGTPASPGGLAPMAPGGGTGGLPGPLPEPMDDAPRAILLEVGGSTVLSSHRPQVLGLVGRVTLRDDRLRIRQSLEWCGGQSGRTLGLLGVGWSFPLARRWTFEALAVGGFDAVSGQPVNVLPAAGLQVDVSWATRASFVDEIGLSLTGLSDLVRRKELLGQPVGGTALSATLTFGFTKGGVR